MKRGAESYRSPPRRQPEVRNMAYVRKELKRSRCIFFEKTLSKTAIQISRNMKTAMLSLPAQFVRENDDKIEQWVILRKHLSCGNSGRPWAVRLSVSESGRVVICGGFYAFVISNGLKVGDSLIFVLQEDIRSEFEVYLFRGPQGVPLYVDGSDSASSDEENDSGSSFPSPSHHQQQRKKPFTRNGEATPPPNASHFDDYRHVHKRTPTSVTREGRATPPQSASHFDYHRVHKKEPIRDMRERRVTRSQSASHFNYHRVHVTRAEELMSVEREGCATPRQFASQFDYHRVHKKEPIRDMRERRVTRSQSASHFNYHRVHVKRAEELMSVEREGWVTPRQFASQFDYHRKHVKREELMRDSRERRATPSPNASHFDYRRVHKREPTSDSREGRARPSRFANPWQNHRVVPFFRKRMTASNIGRSDRDPRTTNSGQFGFPERFLRIHARHIKSPIKLQGIYENSWTHVIECRSRPGTRYRVDLLVTGWSRFVKENRLEKGHLLQFSLMADSYFVVRRVMD